MGQDRKLLPPTAGPARQCCRRVNTPSACIRSASTGGVIRTFGLQSRTLDSHTRAGGGKKGLMADSDDDFGGVDDATLLAAEAVVDESFVENPRPPKRSRLGGPDVPMRMIGKVTVSGTNRSQNAEGTSDSQPFEVSSQQDYGRYRLAGSISNLKQTTLFGTQATSQESLQQTRHHNWPLARGTEKKTHHLLDEEEIKTWVYPTNLGNIREYQFNIVARGLYHNLLVALPTGLGKTFIAATVMLNWFRWTRNSQIVFVAPTRPLVSQQVNACFHVAGIPRSATTMLTGGISPALRAEEWSEKRVFFMTPQTIANDLKSGICDPKRIVLLVVDEAHRATGNYAYVEIVKILRQFNPSFRVLGLTATPGSSVESVQEVIDGLDISRVEIRTEESLDIRQYVHQRNIETTLFEYSEEMSLCMELFSKALQPLVNKLRGLSAYWSHNPMTLTPFGCNQAMKKWMATDAGRRANQGLKGMVMSIFSILASLAHAIELLKFHGIGPFFHKLVEFRTDVEGSGSKASKYKKEVNESEHFITLMRTVQAWVNNKDFVGHPKLEALQSIALNHFMDAGDGRVVGSDNTPPSDTRIMVFAHYRDSAEEIARVLNRNSPLIRAHVFVGQANAKGSEGMDQKKQLDTIEKFRSGVFNILVATSIGEEGLDIGEVDLIVCYDGSASPIRMLQRMGRTGRKRSGNIEVLLMKDREQDNFLKAKDNYEKMQEMIASGKRFTFHDDKSPRIIPREVQPSVDKRIIDIPVENTQADLPEPKRKPKTSKRPPKRFNMPDGVRTGFTKASRLGEADENEAIRPARSPTPACVPPPESVFLTEAETADLERTYLSVSGEGSQVIEAPRLDAHPAAQRSLRPTAFIKHGKASARLASMLHKMHGAVDASPLAVASRYEDALNDEDRAQIDEYFRNVCATTGMYDDLDRTLFGISQPSEGASSPSAVSERLDTSQSTLRSSYQVADELETGSDLADFIDDSELLAAEWRPSSQSSVPSAKPDKPQLLASSQLRDEAMPDIEALLSRIYDMKTTTDVAKTATTRIRRRRAITDSGSDDDL